MSGRPRRIAFDANGLSHLVEDEPLNRAARLRLRELVKRGHAKVIVGHSLATEIAAAPDAKRRREVRELMRLTGGKMLRHWHARAPLEAKLRAMVPDALAMLPAAEGLKYLRDVLLDPAAARAEGQTVRNAKNSFAKNEAVFKTDYQAFADKSSANAWIREFKRAPDTMVDRLYSIFLADHHAFFDLPADPSTWPTPRDFPSFRADVAFHLAHRYVGGLDAVGPGKIDGSDLWDNLHFVDAVYADVLITDDERFRRIVALAGNSGVHLECFEKWGKQLVTCGQRRPD